MPQTRIYVPLNLTTMADLIHHRELRGRQVPAHAVTGAFERSLPGTDEEEREYVALCNAARQASGLRIAAHDRRIVAAADVDLSAVGEPHGPHPEALSLVEVTGPVPMRHIVSFHIDEVGGAEAIEMLWYDVTEAQDALTYAKG